MILNKVEEAIKASMKGDAGPRNFLRLIKGELQMAEVRQNKPLTEEQESNVLKKMLKNNEETLGLLPNTDTRHTVLLQENEVLKGLMPAVATDEEIKAILATVIDQIKAAKNDGQATGVAMRAIKESKLAVDGNAIKAIVATLRSESVQ